MIASSLVGGAAVSIALAWQAWFTPATVPERLEYLPEPSVQLVQSTTITPPVADATGAITFDFAVETVGAQPQTFVPVVGNWLIGTEDGNKLLVVDGRAWSQGQTSAGIADRARSLYGERYAEFLDNVQAYAYYPYAVAEGIENFGQGEIALRFKGVDGRIDQGAGILFDLQPNGDYLTVRANPLENNLVLWQFKRGKRSSVVWIRNTPTPTRTWNELRVQVEGNTMRAYLNGTLYMTQDLGHPVSGRVGVWSKADSVVYFDDYRVTPQ